MSESVQASVWRPEVVPGERVFLSHVQREDVPLLARWFCDMELTAYLGVPGMSFTLEDERAWFEQNGKDRSTKNFAVVVREGQRMIGTVGLKAVNHQQGTAELGIALGDKASWGQGYGSETVRLMADYGFTFLGLHTIFLWHVAFNQRGHHAYLKAGFKPAGRLRGSYTLGGQRYDTILMDITREEFGPSKLTRLIGQLSSEA
jgi:RimJ/RimL family protein N-acetyltransferase